MKEMRRLPREQWKMNANVRAEKVNNKLRIMDFTGFDNLCKETNIYGEAIGLNNCEIVEQMVARVKKWQNILKNRKGSDNSKDEEYDQ